MIEVDLGQVVVNNYEELNSKPKINGVELSGDKSFEELGFEGTKDYSVLENKPSINGTELNGDKTLEELGIASAEELDKTTQKVNTIIEKADLGIKETVSGENIYLTDSAESKVVEFALYGKATQDGEPTPENPVDIVVSGESYNLLKNTATSQIINGVSFAVNEDKSITVNGTASSDTYLNISSQDFGEVFLNVVDNTKEYTLTSGLAKTDNWNLGYNANNKKTSLYVKASATMNNITIYPMIRKASVKNDRYMPYGKGSVEVKSVGKNFLKNTATSQTINGVTFTVNEDKSVTVNGTATARISFQICQTSEFSGKCILSGCPSGGNGKYLLEYSNYVDKSYKDYGAGVEIEKFDYQLYPKARVDIRIESGTQLNNIVFKPMIRLATDTDATYEPYKETLSAIPTDGLAGIPVSSGGNYTDQSGQQWICDEIVKYADGSGEYVQRINKIISDGSSDESWNYDSSIKRFILNAIPHAKTENIRKYVLCSRGLFSQSSHEYGTVFIYNTDLFYYKTDINNVADFKTWLANNNITTYYELAEPIRTPLTAEQIAEIEKVSTFYPVTNISNDFDCGMKVTYLADSKNYIDNQLSLQAQAREQEMMTMFMLLPEETQAAMIENDINNLLLESEV